MRPEVASFYHEDTGTWTYVVSDPDSGEAVIVDPVLDFDYKAARTSTESAREVLEHVRQKGFRVPWILETHAHADHLSAAPFLKRELGAQVAIGEGIQTVQSRFKKLFNLPNEWQPRGAEFDRLFQEGDTFKVGNIDGRLIHTPGHTSDSMSFLIGDALFVGDTIFMPDGGTARCDFPGGDAGVLYDSIQKLFELPDETRMFVCHDYRPGGREERCETTVGEQRKHNIHVGGGASREEFVKFREERDAGLAMPRLIIPSVQVNIRAGELPEPEDNQIHYLKVPLNQLGPETEGGTGHD